LIAPSLALSEMTGLSWAGLGVAKLDVRAAVFGAEPELPQAAIGRRDAHVPAARVHLLDMNIAAVDRYYLVD
jgi:hypothetical protein